MVSERDEEELQSILDMGMSVHDEETLDKQEWLGEFAHEKDGEYNDGVTQRAASGFLAFCECMWVSEPTPSVIQAEGFLEKHREVSG